MLYQQFFGAFLVASALASPAKPAHEREHTVNFPGRKQNLPAANGSKRPFYDEKPAIVLENGELPWQLIDQRRCPNFTDFEKVIYPHNLEICYGTQRYCDEHMWDTTLGEAAENGTSYADSDACLAKRRLPGPNWKVADNRYCPRGGHDAYDGSVDLARCHGTQKYCDERKWEDAISLFTRAKTFPDAGACLKSHLSAWFPGPPPPKVNFWKTPGVNLSLILSLSQEDVVRNPEDSLLSQPIAGKLIFQDGQQSYCDGRTGSSKEIEEYCLGTVVYCERNSKDQVECIKKRYRPKPKFYEPIEKCKRLVEKEVCVGTERYCQKRAIPAEDCLKLRQM